MVRVKGYEITEIKVKNSFLRRAQAYKNSIESNLKKLGIHEDNIEINLENNAIARRPAKASWYFDGHYHFYSYNRSKFVENMYVISKLIGLFVSDVLNDVKSLAEFSAAFTEDQDIDKKRIEARNYFGLEQDFTVEQVNKKYKLLSKKLHPDMPEGNTENFKELNEMHKIIKREFS